MQGGRKIIESVWVKRMFLMVVYEFSFDLSYYIENLELLVRSYTKNLQ